MKKNNWLPYIGKLLWVIGLITIPIIFFNFEYELGKQAEDSYNYTLFVWYKVGYSLLLGIYLSLAFVKGWSLNINKSTIFCVTLPSFIVLLAYPALGMFLSWGYLPAFIIGNYISDGLQAIQYSNIAGIATGLSLVLGLFGKPKSQE